MGQLELLWQLQNHNLKIKKLKSELERLAKKGHIETITLKLNNLSDQLSDKKEELKKNDEKFRKNDTSLKGLTFQLKEVENELYDGQITDIKQLNYMTEECEKLKKLINSLEDEMLFLMEDMDNIEEEIIRTQEEYDKIKKQFKKTTKEYNEIVLKVRQKIREEMANIYHISGKIDKDLYEKYISLKDKKTFAVAKVENNQCRGCNIIIPTYLIDNLKRDKKLQYCENCGRILYLG